MANRLGRPAVCPRRVGRCSREVEQPREGLEALGDRGVVELDRHDQSVPPGRLPHDVGLLLSDLRFRGAAKPGCTANSKRRPELKAVASGPSRRQQQARTRGLRSPFVDVVSRGKPGWRLRDSSTAPLSQAARERPGPADGVLGELVVGEPPTHAKVRENAERPARSPTERVRGDRIHRRSGSGKRPSAQI